jgi:hypothetical protein
VCQAGRLVGAVKEVCKALAIRSPLQGRHDEAVGPDQADRARYGGQRTADSGRRAAMGKTKVVRDEEAGEL